MGIQELKADGKTFMAVAASFCEALGGSCTLEDCQHPGAAQPDFLKVTWGI